MRGPYTTDLGKIDLEPTRGPETMKFGTLATNIEHYGGLLYPLILREEGSRFVIVEGMRRLLSVRSRMWTEAPAFVVAGRSPEAALLSMIEQQDYLGLDAFTLAEALERAFNLYNIDMADVARWANTTPRVLQNAYSLLLRATPALLKAVHDGWVSPGQGTVIAGMAPQQQHKHLNKLYSGSQEVADGSKRGRRYIHGAAQGHRGRAEAEPSRLSTLQEDRRSRA